MADTIADISIDSTSFTNVNLASSIVEGTNVDIQNKSSSVMILQIQDATPSDTSADGYYIVPNQILTIPAGTNILWMRSASLLGQVLLRDLT